MKYFGRVAMQGDEFEARLTRALEQTATPAVPADFAARVTAALPARKPRRRRFSVGQAVAVVAVVVMLGGLVWLAPRSAASFGNWAFDGEMLLVGTLMVMGGWFGLARAKA